MKFLSVVFFVFSMIASTGLISQQRAASPASTLTQKVGLTDITVEYSRPGAKERTIFAADGLVPFGKLWRTGANSATKITFSDAVKIEGKELAAGSYALLTLPGESSWKVHFYKHDSSSWGNYREKEPAAAVTVTPVKMQNERIESFTIDIGNLRDNSATLVIAWDDTYVPVNLTVK